MLVNAREIIIDLYDNQCKNCVKHKLNKNNCELNKNIITPLYMGGRS